jgi:hypothetical protein
MIFGILLLLLIFFSAISINSYILLYHAFKYFPFTKKYFEKIKSNNDNSFAYFKFILMLFCVILTLYLMNMYFDSFDD